MRKITLLLILIIGLPIAIMAENGINLTPVPMKMTVGNGKLTLPEKFAIATNGIKEAETETKKFSSLFSKVSGYIVTVANDENALIKMQKYNGNEELGNEGYTLDITADGITIAANSANGFYYAFQSIKKMLPANVMAEVKDENVTEYSLPIVSIVDAPRFEYRGFMLDVSRHYFTTDQIKRMIDVMSYYKMNRFHWHLTDDQGWRFEVKKYPRLTTVGATRNNSWSVDPEYGGYYTNEIYGPYFYTQEECRDIVAYAAERHIEVVPEVEFPGHSCAVNAAYPEFSCNPNGAHSVQVNGGIFNDVLNVANPSAVQFVKDVIDEVIEVFPYHQIHIGGDETPTSAWEGNAECKALMQEKGFTHVRQLQSYFVRQISDHVTQKEGDKKRSIIMWNESLTAQGTDEELIKGTGGMMMCWESGQVQPCARKAAEFGMKSVITPWGPYYINRKQSTDPSEPTGAGYGDDTVEKTYNYVPVPTDVPANLQKYYVGVQGTFWTEHVQSNYLLEYLALPRLIAIAETGWTPANKKNFEDFQQRITKDTLLLNYNNYEYGRHYILDNKKSDKVMPTASTDENKAWYRIVTTATDESRAGRCIQLLREGSSEIGTGNAQVDRLWNSEVIEDENNAGYDYQLWAFMQDPNNPERWAIVNKAKPNGSVKGTPTAENNTGRWDYDENTRHYDFILGDKVYAKNGDNYNYSIRSQKVSNTSMCLNYAGPGQTYSINLWSDPTSGNGGIWEFRPLETKVMPTASTDENKAWYRIISKATDESRAGRCIQLLREGSSEIGTGNAQVDRLWNSEVIEDENNAGYDYQLWAFMQDPNNPERWAIVNKAKPNGSVKGTPTAENNTGRWDYDENTRHYDFILGDKVYAKNGDNYNYSIRSQKVSNTSMCLNYAGAGQNYSINLWEDPTSSNAGVWEFRPLVVVEEPIVIDYPVAETTYRIVNNTERFKGWGIYDNNDGIVTASTQEYGVNLWDITESEITQNGQTFKLRNSVTGRYISGSTAPLALSDNGVTLTNVYNTKSGDFSIKIDNKAIYPLSDRATSHPNTLTLEGIYPQGTGWLFEKAHLVAYTCVDEENNTIQTVYQTPAEGETLTAVAPEIANYEIVKYKVGETGSTEAPVFENINESKNVYVTYKRISNSVTYRCYTTDGIHIDDYTTPCLFGEAHTVACPEIEFFTLVSCNEEQEVITPEADTVIEAYYETEGVIGVASIGNAVTTLVDGGSYLIYNAMNEAARSGFLSVSDIGAGITTTNGITEGAPGFVWNFKGENNRFTVKNNYDIYIPQLLRGGLVTGGEKPEEFTFTFDTNSNTWSVKGTSNNLYWNGNANNTFTGWDNGHPFIIYSYKPQPYFVVSYKCIDENGEELASGSRYVKGGDDYTMITPTIDNYTFESSDAVYEELTYVKKNIELTLTYKQNITSIEDICNEKIESPSVIYDLQGRQVTAPTKGIYIKNGYKILIK